jgi:DNA-binding NtrC family response regulator
LFWNYHRTLEQFEREYFQRALSRNAGRIARTAKKIGLNKSTFLRRVRAYGLDSGRLGLHDS